jgi:multicomponent K+:H+ antiporter subunit F
VALAMLLCGWRLLRGPELPDRVLALDTWPSTWWPGGAAGHPVADDLLFEAALIIAMLGFVSTVALARYLSRGDVME